MSVEIAVVVLRSGMVLLARHAPGSPRAGLWGFPGGPLAAGETPAAGAARLLREQFRVEAEVGAEAARAGARVGMLVPKFAGTLAPVVHDAIRWVEARRLLEHELVPEDRPIAEVVASHRRRDRYTGTHPKAFQEKYKELGGDPEAVAKAKARGSTPAGGHLPIMVAEILDALSPLSGATVLDCTLGSGGHTTELARLAGSTGKVIGLDHDGEELARTVEKLRARGVTVIARQSDYADARSALRALGVDAVDALLADLGVSSMQLDRPERGMSFKNDGPLDMRMDRSRGLTAAQWLASASEADIADALTRYGDEPDATKIAATLVALRVEGRAPKTTYELSSAVGIAKGLGPGRVVKKDAFSAHPATRTFQALRIAVNGERESLTRLLNDLPAIVRPGGRVAFLTFHSGEEKLLKETLDSQAAAGFWRAAPEPPRKASPEEVRENPRARSARLWLVVRSAKSYT